MSTVKPKLSDRIYAVERVFVALCTGVMGVLVFLDVVHRVATRERDTSTSVIIAAVALGFTFLALRTRKTPSSTALQLVASVVLVAVGFGLLQAFVRLLPNGLIWSQTLGLVLMLWVAMIGASMATHDHRHLALDVGAKLWPKAWLPKVQAVGNVVTGLFCAVLGVLSVVSIQSHYGDWAETDGAGGHFVALALPKWLAFVFLPTGFALMALRFFGHAVDGALRGDVEEDDAMHMLGLDEDIKEIERHDREHPDHPQSSPSPSSTRGSEVAR